MEKKNLLMGNFRFGKNMPEEQSMIESLREFLGPMSKDGTIVVVSYGLKSKDYDSYLIKMAKIFSAMGYNNLASVHTYAQPLNLIQDPNVQAIFVGGEDIQLLREELIEKLIFTAIATRVTKGIKYIGSEAGSDIFSSLMA